MSLSEKEAAEIMRHMPAGEVQRLGKAMASLRKVSRDQADQVLTHFTDNVEGQGQFTSRSTASIKRLLTSSLGEEKATKVIDRIVEETPRGLDSLHLLESKEIAEFIGREHPQVIAVVLAGMAAKKASQVINLLPVQLATDIVARIARMAEIPHNTIEELDEIMQQKFSHTPVAKVMPIGGIRSAAGILNGVGKETEKKIIETLNENNAVLCQEIQDNMFVFDNLIDIDDRGIQALVREVTSDMLVVALKGADQALQDKIFRNMSKRAGEMLRSDFEAKGPVRLAEVEAAQKEIVMATRRLADDGTINLGGGDDFV